MQKWCPTYESVPPWSEATISSQRKNPQYLENRDLIANHCSCKLCVNYSGNICTVVSQRVEILGMHSFFCVKSYNQPKLNKFHYWAFLWKLEMFNRLPSFKVSKNLTDSTSIIWI
jgi:hypothetical protein